MLFLVVGMEKGLIDREKGGASRDVDYCSYRELLKGLIDREKGGLVTSSTLYRLDLETLTMSIYYCYFCHD